MALGTPANVIAASGTTAATTTGSFTVPSGDEIYVTVGSRKSGSAHSALTISDSLGLTWASVGSAFYDDGSGVRVRCQVWRATSTGAAMTATGTPGGTTPDNIGIQIVSIAGASTDVTNASTGTNGSGDPSVTLPSAPDVASTVLAFGMFAGGNAISPPTGCTELNEFATSGSSHRLESAYDAASAATTIAWTTSNFESAAVVVEVKTGTTTQTLRPSLFANGQTFYSPTVTPGAVDLAPLSFTNTQPFFSPAVAPGAVTLLPALFTNTRTFHSPIVSPGNSPLAAILFTNPQVFYSPTAALGSVTLSPPLLNNEQTFPSPALGSERVERAPPPECILTLYGQGRTVTVARLSIRALRPTPLGRRLPVPQPVRTVVCGATPPRLLAVPRDNPRQVIA